MNHPPTTKKSHVEEQKGREEATMINNLVEIVDEKCEGRRVAEPLRQQLLRQNSLGQAADCISQQTGLPIDFLSKNFVSQPQQPQLLSKICILFCRCTINRTRTKSF